LSAHIGNPQVEHGVVLPLTNRLGFPLEDVPPIVGNAVGSVGDGEVIPHAVVKVAIAIVHLGL